MIRNILKTTAFGLFSIGTFASNAQVCHNLYPYVDGVVYDNNGHDLAGFIKNNKKDAAFKAAKVDEFSSGHWGYIQVNNARVPSVNIHTTAPGKKVDLNFSEYINATLALYNTKDGIKATWWARQCNNPHGPMFYKKTENSGDLGADVTRYENLKSAYATKDFTIVEFNDSTYNHRDYDQLLRNYIIIENGAVQNVNDYHDIIEFYTKFLSKFTYIEDPLLEKKSFITCFTVNRTKYFGYFNVVNAKLAGNLQVADIQYENDKDTLVANTMKLLKGNEIYVYGDDIFGMEKTFLKYAHNHPALKMIRRKPADAGNFNKEDK